MVWVGWVLYYIYLRCLFIGCSPDVSTISAIRRGTPGIRGIPEVSWAHGGICVLFVCWHMDWRFALDRVAALVSEAVLCCPLSLKFD
jgi:hypothetical protein